MPEAPVVAPETVTLDSVPIPSLCWGRDDVFMLVHAKCPLTYSMLVSEWVDKGWKPTKRNRSDRVEPFDPACRPPPSDLSHHGLAMIKGGGLLPPSEQPTKTQYAFSCHSRATTDVFPGGVRIGRPTSAEISVSGFSSPQGNERMPLDFIAKFDQNGMTLAVGVHGFSAQGSVRFTYPQLYAFILSGFEPKKDLKGV